jgi:hypothetical protein
MTGELVSTTDCRRAIEALRSGVPNRDAVRVMGCNQGAVERLFIDKLRQVPEHLAADKQVSGLLVSGDFGSGKSHLLEYLEYCALLEGFICSRVVISKETPLYDPAKLYRAAIESAVIPAHAGHAIQEMALRLHDSDEYARFYQWCNKPDAGVGALFPATLFLHQRLKNDPELVEAIVNFWSGERLVISEVKRGLRLVAAASLFHLRAVPARRLSLERFLFTARMVTGAGYKGWVILLDEVELIGRYSFLQRAKSYGELARWMGLLEAEHYPGILTVAAITADFDAAVLDRKGDFSSVRPKLESKGSDEDRAIAARAEAGMRTIRRGAVELKQPDEVTLRQTYARLRQLHARAYGWEPPDIAVPKPSLMTTMRTHVRRWINEWDLTRLYPGVPITIEELELAPSYEELPELEAPPELPDKD